MPNEQDRTGTRSFSRTRLAAILAAGALTAGAILSVQAVADSKTYRHVAAEAGYQMGFHRAGDKRFGEMTEAEIEERVSRVVRHVAIEIDANDDQQEKIVALLTEVAREMQPLRASFMANRDRMKDLLLAETVDRAAMEQMRAARIAEIDEISKNMVTAIADVAEVLTVEQRRVLEERIREFRSMMGHRGRRGWRH